MPSLEDALRATLMYAVVPLWALAGFGDWLCHRWQRLELTAGVGESLLHLLMLALLGPALLAVLLFEVNALLLALLLAAAVAHELVFWCDLFYACARRRIPPVEQWIHGVQFAVPWVGLAGLMLLHRDQALAGVAGAPLADWSLQLKNAPLPDGYVAGVLVVAVLLVGLPFVEELLRCRRALSERAAAPAVWKQARPEPWMPATPAIRPPPRDPRGGG